MTDQEELEYLKALVNNDLDSSASSPVNQNWGFCSENCLNPNSDQEYSEVYMSSLFLRI